MSARLAPIEPVGLEAAANGVDRRIKSMSGWLASRGSGSFKGELLADGVVRFGTTQLGSKGYVDSSFHCDIFPGVANLMPLRSCRCPET